MAVELEQVYKVTTAGAEQAHGRVEKAAKRSFDAVDKGSKRGRSALGQFTKSANRSKRSVVDLSKATRGLGSVLGGPTLGIAALALGLVKASKAAGTFNKDLAEVGTLLGDVSPIEAFGKSLDEVGDELLSMAGPLGSARELTQGLYLQLSAGTAPAAALEAIADNARFAKAGVATLAEAVDLNTTSINAWNLSTAEAERVNDIWFTTIKLGKTTLAELAANVGKVAATADATKVPIEDVAAAIAELTSKGENTERATTGINSLLNTFLKGAPKFKAAGIDILSVLDERGLVGAMEELRRVTGGDPIQVAKLIPETTALKTAMSLLSDESSGLKDKLEQISDSSGAVETAFQQMSKSSGVFFIALRDKLEAKLIQVGTAINDLLVPALMGLIDAVENDAVVAAWGDAWDTVTDALLEVKRTADDLLQVLRDISGDQSLTFGDVLVGSLITAANRVQVLTLEIEAFFVGMALTATSTMQGLLKALFAVVDDSLEKITKSLDSVASFLFVIPGFAKESAAIFDLRQNLVDLRKDLKAGGDASAVFGESAADLAVRFLDLKGRIDEVGQVVPDLTGVVGEGKAKLDEFKGSAKGAGDETGSFNRNVVEATGAVGQLVKSVSGDTFVGMTIQAINLQAALDGMIGTVDEGSPAWDKLTDDLAVVKTNLDLLSGAITPADVQLRTLIETAKAADVQWKVDVETLNLLNEKLREMAADGLEGTRVFATLTEEADKLGQSVLTTNPILAAAAERWKEARGELKEAKIEMELIPPVAQGVADSVLELATTWTGAFSQMLADGVGFVGAIQGAFSKLTGGGGLGGIISGLFGGKGGGQLGKLLGGTGIGQALQGLIGPLSAALGPFGPIVSSLAPIALKSLSKLGGKIFKGIKGLFGGGKSRETKVQESLQGFGLSISEGLGKEIDKIDESLGRGLGARKVASALGLPQIRQEVALTTATFPGMVQVMIAGFDAAAQRGELTGQVADTLAANVRGLAADATAMGLSGSAAFDQLIAGAQSAGLEVDGFAVGGVAAMANFESGARAAALGAETAHVQAAESSAEAWTGAAEQSKTEIESITPVAESAVSAVEAASVGASGAMAAAANSAASSAASAAARVAGSLASVLGAASRIDRINLDGIDFGLRGAGSVEGRAHGGDVNAGQLYRVNERGTGRNAEFFRPSRSGEVIPLADRRSVPASAFGRPPVADAGAGGGVQRVEVRLPPAITLNIDGQPMRAFVSQGNRDGTIAPEDRQEF